MAAPKGNTYAHARLIFKTPEELEKAIDEYFAYCDNRIKTIHTKEGEEVGVNIPAPYTMAGLAYALGVDRKTIINYKRNEKYFHAIKKARDKVEEFAETQLYEGKNTAGVIFNLKNNFDWKDKTEQDITSDGKQLGATITFEDKPEA